MNKERKVISRDAIVVFDRYVRASELNALFNDFHGDIVINGGLLLYEDDLCINCDNLYVECIELIDGCAYPGIRMKGNLYVNGDCEAYDIEVNGSVYCQGNFESTEIDIAEDFFVKGEVDAYNSHIHMGGEFICLSSVKNVRSLWVLDKYDIKGSMIEVYDIRVG